jgi:formylglycine-generating enzyme required for sulfatase activity
MPKQQKRTVKVNNIPNWPFSEEKAKEMQKALGQVDTTVKVGPCDIKLKHIPAGQFIMGRKNGENDELPKAVKIEKPFWMTTTEVTNKLYKQFNSEHVSGLVDALGKDHGGYFFNVNGDNYPVIRISWNEANQFCKWLSKKTGKKFRLPTESEWEWAARAGTNTDFFYGNAKTDFSKYANLADATMKKFDWRATHNYMMRRDDVNDQEQYMATRVYAPNAFGLSNMIGNVAEWTSSIYKFKNQEKGKLVISKGGSWRDMPRWVPVASKVPYRTYQKVFNVGIRLVMEE